MRPDRLLLEDILDAIAEVLDVTPSGRAEFDANKLIRSHVCGTYRSSARRCRACPRS